MVSEHVLEIAGTARRYLVAEPSGPVSDIVISLHGTRSTPDGQARLSGLGGLAGTEGAVAVFQANVPIGSGYEWDHSGDLSFLLHLVDEIQSQYQTPDGGVLHGRNVRRRSNGVPLCGGPL